MTGWTWSEIDELDLPRVKKLYEYWAEHPPVHELAAAYLGFKAPTAARDQAPDLNFLRSIAPNGVG